MGGSPEEARRWHLMSMAQPDPWQTTTRKLDPTRETRPMAAMKNGLAVRQRQLLRLADPNMRQLAACRSHLSCLHAPLAHILADE